MDWLKSLPGGVVGTMATLIRWWNRPHLAITYLDTEHGFRVFTEERYTSFPYAIPLRVMYVSIRIQNTGRSTATQCRGFLVGIDRKGEGGQWLQTDYCQSIPLAWSYSTDDDARSGVDIPKEVSQFLNVFSIGEDTPGIRPATVPRTRRLNELTKPGEFRFKIQLSTDNGPTQLFGIHVSWSGNWDELWQGNCKGLQILHSTVRWW